MEIQLKTNRAAGIGSCLFALLIWWLIPQQIQDLSGGSVSARFLPQMVVVVMFIGGIALVVQSFTGTEKEVTLNLGKVARELAYAAVLFAYVALFGRIGFMLASILLGIASLLLLRSRKWQYYLTVIVVPLILQFLFANLLQVPLP